MISQDTLNSSSELVQTCVQEIRKHLKESKNNNYDWRYEIIEALDIIDTECESWKTKTKIQSNETECLNQLKKT